jgi:signal transduction histidine kinase
MMHEFLTNNRDELAKRCRVKVGMRSGRSATDVQLREGIPLFLDQLIRTLKVEQSAKPMDSRKISGPAGGGVALSEVSVSAAQHGKDLLGLGLTVDQVVHDYGDLCQAITDLAVERDAPFAVDEFRTLNRCLDNAISDAVTEFSYQREIAAATLSADESDKRIGFFAHELRNMLGTASLAFSAVKLGNLSLSGATGSILERTLNNLEKLITDSVRELKSERLEVSTLHSFSLAIFITELYNIGSLSSRAHGCALRVEDVDADLAINGERDLLLSAVSNLIQNAFKFTKPGTEVILSAYSSAGQILIDVEDHCGGLSVEAVTMMFLPFTQHGTNRSGMGLGLTIARKSVVANKGTLTVHNRPGRGCIFRVSLPRHQIVS